MLKKYSYKDDGYNGYSVGVLFHGKIYKKDEAVKEKLAVFVQRERGKEVTYDVYVKSAKFIIFWTSNSGFQRYEDLADVISHVQYDVHKHTDLEITEEEAHIIVKHFFPNTHKKLSSPVLPDVEDVEPNNPFGMLKGLF